MGSYLCLLTPLNWEEQWASPVMERTLRLRRVLLLPPATGRRAQDTASVSLPLSASSTSPVGQDLVGAIGQALVLRPILVCSQASSLEMAPTVNV